MEQVLYTYDSLNRLASAQTAGAGGWGQSYTYDGFGNLTDQTLTKGSAPDVHVAYNYLTNRQTGDTADANGNIGVGYNYDIDNRLVQPGSSSPARYAYDAANKRVWRGDTGSGLDEIAFWAGQKLATYQVNYTGSVISFGLTSTNVYFGSKLISKGAYNISGSGDYVNLTPVVADRLGSIGKFYPYGVERPSATQNDKEKFTGYFRDAATGLDYADQRYEQPGVGRFMTPDSAPSVKPRDPGSWNRYAYVGGDPINQVDPTGQDIGYFGGSYSVGAPDVGDFGGCDYYCEVGVAAANYWLNLYYSYLASLTNQYNSDVSLLQPLQDQGLISGYSVDFWTGNATIQIPDVYLSSLVPLVIGGAIAVGEIIDGVYTITVTVWGAIKVWEVLHGVTAPKWFDPLEEITKKGSQWTGGGDDWERDCPPGSKRKVETLHRDDGIKYNEGAHWDWVDCNGNSWKIYPDGSVKRS